MSDRGTSPVWRAEANSLAASASDEDLLKAFVGAYYAESESWGEEARKAECQLPILRQAVLQRMAKP